MDLNRRYEFKEKYDYFYYLIEKEIKRLDSLKRTMRDKRAEHLNKLLEGK